MELNDPHGLTSMPAALELFTDSLAHLMLDGLPHNYSARLSRSVVSPIPSHLRRALAFMDASADRPVTMADVAAATGCGTRTLLNSFRRFRDTTPLAALRDIRLQHARAALLAGADGETTRTSPGGLGSPTRPGSPGVCEAVRRDAGGDPAACLSDPRSALSVLRFAAGLPER